MTRPPSADGVLRVRTRDAELVWSLECPQCAHWGDIDDDQRHGRVSVDHTNCGHTYEDSVCECTFHETRDWARTAKIEGHRLPAEDFKLIAPTVPGEYCGPIVGYTGTLPAVFFLKPNARDEDAPPAARSLQHVVSPPHTFTEEPDGSLTIAASISDKAVGSDDSDGWHGYLEAGVWRLA